MALSTAMVITSSASAGVEPTVSISASKDNTLYESADGLLSNGVGEHLFAGATGGAALRRGLLAFDIAGAIPAGSVITSVELTLQMDRTVSGALTVSLRRALQDWGEGASNAVFQGGGQGIAAEPGDATWKHTFHPTGFWQTLGGDFEVLASASQQVAGLGSYTWGSTANLVCDVQGWLDTPSANFGWVIIGAEQTPFSAKRFASRDNLISTVRPVLSVTYIPGIACPGDGNDDGIVDFADINSVLGNWLKDYLPCTGPGDANGDGIVDFGDLNAVLGNWLAVCQ